MRSKLLTFVLPFLFAAMGAAVVYALAGNGDDGAPSIDGVMTSERRGGAEPTLNEGDEAPDFQAETIDGDVFRLSDHRGEIVLLNFWATWCAPCRVEIPDLIEMQANLADQGVRFAGISLDEGPEADVAAYAREAGMNYPVMIDEGPIARKFGGVYALPTTVVVDREGVVRFRKAGLVTKESLLPILRDLAEV